MDKSIFNKTDIFIDKSQIIEKDGKFGLIDSNDNIITECKFNEVKQFKNGFLSIIKVRTETLWGILNDKGELIIQCNYDDIFPIWGQNIFLAKNGNKWGSIDKNEEPISGFVLDECYDEYLLSTIRYEDVNDSNKDILYFREALIRNKDWDTNFSKGFFRGLISSKTGKIILTPRFYSFDKEFVNNILRVHIKNNFIGAIDIHGNEIVPCEYQDVQAFGNGNILVKSNDIWRFFNAQIELSNLTDLIDVNKDLKFAKQGKKWGLIDFNGNILIPFDYDEANTTSLKKGKYWYLVDFSNKVVTDCNYESKFEYNPLRSNLYYKDGFYGYYSDYKVIVPFDIEEIDRNNEEGYFNNIKRNGKWGLTQSNFKELALNCEYDFKIINNIYTFENSQSFYLFKLTKNGKIGFVYISPDNYEVKIKFDCTFEDGDILDKDLLIVKHEETGNKWFKISLLDDSSKTLEEFDDWNNGLVKKDNKWSIVGKDEYIYSNIKTFENYGFFAENGSKWDLIRIDYSYNSETTYWRNSIDRYNDAYLKCGKIVVISNIESWQYVDKHVVRLTSKGKKGLVSSDYKVKDKHSNYIHTNRIFLDCSYDAIEYNFSEGYSLLKRDSYFSIFSHYNTQILESEYNYIYISEIVNDYAVVKRKNIVPRGFWGKKIEKEYFGIIEIREKKIIEKIKCEYDSIELTKDNKLIITKENKKAIIDLFDYDTFIEFSL